MTVDKYNLHYDNLYEHITRILFDDLIRNIKNITYY